MQTGVRYRVTGCMLANTQSDASLVALSECCSDGVIVFGPEHIAHVNAAAAALLGFDRPDQLIGSSLGLVVYADDLPGLLAERGGQHELRCLRRDGALLEVQARCASCEYGGGAATVMVLRDLTHQHDTHDDLRRSHDDLETRIEQRTAELARARSILRHEAGIRGRTEQALLEREQQLHQALKMEAIGRLAGGVAHDFNNLLSVILSYTQLMKPSMPPDRFLREGVTEIEQAGLRAADLTRQLLAFSRQQLLEPRVLDLGAVVTSLGRMLQRILGEDLQLRIVTQHRLHKARLDQGSIEQALVNLVVNARDAMPRGGQLQIETANAQLEAEHIGEHDEVTAGDYVQLMVSDTGTGMDAHTLARIFEPFFTTKPKGKGTGLGLSMVYGTVKQSGGHLRVHSEPGRGSTFSMYFPAVEAELEEDSSAHAPALLPGSHETVLVVEDADVVRAVLRTILQHHAYRVLEAATPAQAIEHSRQQSGPIDLLLTDVVMPDMSGPELARLLLADRPQMRVLYISGYADDTVMHHGLRHASMPFLQKPFTPESLLRKLREVLGRP